MIKYLHLSQDRKRPLYKLIFTNDKEFSDWHWQEFFKLLETLHKKYKTTLLTRDWHDLKSRWLSYYETNKDFKQAVIFKDNHAALWGEFRVHNAGKQEQTTAIFINGLFEQMPPQLEKMILDWFIEEAKRYKSEKIFCTFFDKRFVDCVRKWGAEELSRQDQYFLYRDKANHEILRQWRETIPKDNPDLKIEFYDDVPDKYLSEFSELLQQYLNEMPEESRGGMPLHIDEKRIKRDREWRKKNNIGLYELFLVDENGNIIGLTGALVNKNKPKYAHQVMTGINKKYRGRDLAKFLKAELFYKINEIFPDNDIFITEMRTINEPIHEINRQMGYVLERTGQEFKIEIEFLNDYRDKITK